MTTEKRIDLPISNLADGAIQEKLDLELSKIFNNIHDENTEATDKRTVTLKLEFKPDENRQTIAVNSEVVTKLAKVKGVALTVLTGKDLSKGEIEARELKSSIPGQTYFDDDLQHKTDVGEPVDFRDSEKKNKVINFREGN